MVCDPAWQVSTAKRQLQLALEQQGLAQKLLAMAVKEKNQEKIDKRAFCGILVSKMERVGRNRPSIGPKIAISMIVV